jgi:AcrR family transcriptional regulator
MSTTSRRRPGRPRQMPAHEQRAVVLDAARRVFARTGLRAATIGEIARVAGVSRQSVYAQFENKATLFDAAVTALVGEMKAAFGSPSAPGPADDDVAWLRCLYSPVLTYFAQHPEALSLFKEADRVNHPTFLQYRVELAAAYEHAILERTAQRGLRLGRLPRVLVVMFIAMSSALLTMVEDGSLPDAEVLGDLLAEFTVGGFGQLVTRAPEIIERLG